MAFRVVALQRDAQHAVSEAVCGSGQHGCNVKRHDEGEGALVLVDAEPGAFRQSRLKGDRTGVDHTASCHASRIAGPGRATGSTASGGLNFFFAGLLTT